MELTPTVIEKLLLDVIESRIDQDTLEALGLIAKSADASRQFVGAIMASGSVPSDGNDAAVHKTMCVLEAVADKSELVGCVLMAHLYPVADAQQSHDVCNAINLWLAECKSPELRQHLLLLASRQGDDDLRRHYERMAG
jgi:hypothetical protein